MRAFSVTELYERTRAARNSSEALAAQALAVQPRPLTPQEQGFARTAWTYFERHADAGTGFAPAIAPRPVLSPWEMGATLAAIAAAARLGLIRKPRAEDMTARLLLGLSSLPLDRTGLPGRRYDTRTLAALDAHGTPITDALGYSARELFRLVAGFVATAHHFPALAPEISLILRRWPMNDLIGKARLLAGFWPPGARSPTTYSDACLGYEQYAARAADLIGLPARHLLDPRRTLVMISDDTGPLPADRRRATPVPVVTPDPFLLDALEFGWRADMLDIAVSQFQAQHARFEKTGVLTAPGEDALDRAPGYAFFGVTAGQDAFASRSRGGRNTDRLRAFSTKAAFAWHSLLPSPYSQKLEDATDGLHTAEGWLAGRYEATGVPNGALSLNTNAMILEALHYRAFGPLFPTSE
jgi:hypothetical protein